MVSGWARVSLKPTFYVKLKPLNSGLVHYGLICRLSNTSRKYYQVIKRVKYSISSNKLHNEFTIVLHCLKAILRRCSIKLIKKATFLMYIYIYIDRYRYIYR